MADISPFEEEPFSFDPQSLNAAEERWFKTLSPELQDQIRKQKEVLLLPHWPERTRGVPNLCLRSGLFRVIGRGRRRAVKGECIASVKGLNIRYTGWQLDQGDLDVLAQALHLQSCQVDKMSENYVRFEMKSFLRSIGRQPGKSGREWTKDCLRRLTATAVEIKFDIHQRFTNEAVTYAGSLIDEFCYNDSEQTYFLKLNPKLAILFDAGWTQLQWQQRLRLKTNLAKWLHGFYASHREPYSIKIDTLKFLCGSDCKRQVDFRRGLHMAMDELVSVGAIQAWDFDNNNKLHVQRFAGRQISK